ncbi:BREX system serine/threonine kinase PglW [Dactylosporangium sp. NBC_01737]|uniref:BREX system serine/threonine kinase PglW n=1 Tax=Dactylosporangium sp. NBC_01737 TaxID=2975959 RepID=UPI002E13F6D5|nr:BREX system serine/threonine kinase PglW [Dactylosporangium sp. NBC_01737]
MITIRPDSPRWREINASDWPHEREGLQQIQSLLPDGDPYHAWANVEFQGTDGSVNEVDLLILLPQGLYVLELKHWQGEIGGDGFQWRRTMPNGRVRIVDNPVILANRKARRLRSLLEQYATRTPGRRARVPYVDAAVFLHAANVRSTLDPIGRQRVYGPHGSAAAGLEDVERLLIHRPASGGIDRTTARDIVALIEACGLRPSVSKRMVGQLLLAPRPFAEGVGWQDFLAGHQQTDLVRRVRFYLTGRADADQDMIRRAAEREFRLLQGIRHDGIVQAHDLVEHAHGPAVIFDHGEEWVRLDQWLAEHDAELTIDKRLDLVRELADTMRYAHSRHLVHRNLNPRSIFVRKPASSRPGLVIIDWQTGGRIPGTTTTSQGAIVGTQHVEQLVDEQSRVYQAPEVTNPEAPGVLLDVFALGAVSYHILTGRPPATSVAERKAVLDLLGGLDITASFDAAPSSLVNLVFDATCAVVPSRTKTVALFLAGLDQVEEDLTAPDPVPQINPLQARSGDVLEGGLTVVDRLGAGATSIAFLVRDEHGTEIVLKVARDPEKNQRLLDEAAVLDRVPHWQIIRLIKGPIEVGGQIGLLLDYAGPKTLADQLASGGRLNLEQLERYGKDLLDVIRALDAEGITHRDIKPANLAARPRSKDGELHLCVFDFSLAAAPADQLTAGTPPYLDPFLGPPRRARYDAAAERFAIGVTLYEMATGTLPRWGDGVTYPAHLTDEVSLPPELFDPSIAEGMVAFFAKALARDARRRFDTFEDMADAWRRVFVALPAPGTDHGTVIDGGPAALGLDTPLERVGLTPKARSALERIGVHTVADLVHQDQMALSRLAGVSQATKTEIRRRAKELRAVFSVSQTETSEPTGDPGLLPVAGVETLIELLATPPSSRRRSADTTVVPLLLGTAVPPGGHEPLRWPSQVDLARHCGVTSQRVSQIMERLTDRWLDVTALDQVRNEIVALLDGNGGVMSVDELGDELIAAHGSFSPEPKRTTQAIGLVRAAVETELARGGDARLDQLRIGATVLIGREPDDPDSEHTAEEFLQYASRLGKIAQRLAATPSLPTRTRVLERLRELPPPVGLPQMSDSRLLSLAAAAGAVAVNAQEQLYPIGLAAETALRLAAGSLAVPPGRSLSIDEVRKRVRARFPRAAELPGRPALDRLLAANGVALEWRHDRYTTPTSPGSDLFASRTRATTGPLLPAGPDAAAEADARLAAVLDRDGFLAVLVKPSALDGARRALLERFGLTELNVTAVLVETLRSLGVPWELILESDAREPAHPDRRNLESAVRAEVVPRLQSSLATGHAVLLTEAAPLARYGCMDLIATLADNGVPRPAARLLLVPAPGSKQLLDDQPIPVTSGSQLTWLPDVWWRPVPATGKANA